MSFLAYLLTFVRRNNKTEAVRSPEDFLKLNGFDIGVEADPIFVPTVLTHSGRKPRICDGMPISSSRREEVPSTECTTTIKSGEQYVKMSGYQFSWWDDRNRDPAQWTKIKMCIPCALEAEVIKHKSEG